MLSLRFSASGRVVGEEDIAGCSCFLAGGGRQVVGHLDADHYHASSEAANRKFMPAEGRTTLVPWVAITSRRSPSHGEP
jgi:hypothetical protein